MINYNQKFLNGNLIKVFFCDLTSCLRLTFFHVSLCFTSFISWKNIGENRCVL